MMLTEELGRPIRGGQRVCCPGAWVCGRGPGRARNCVKMKNLLKHTQWMIKKERKGYFCGKSLRNVIGKFGE